MELWTAITISVLVFVLTLTFALSILFECLREIKNKKTEKIKIVNNKMSKLGFILSAIGVYK